MASYHRKLKNEYRATGVYRLLTLLWGHILDEDFVPRVINVSHGSVQHKRDSEVHLCPPDLPTDHLIVGISREEWDYLYTKLPMSS